MKISKHLGNHIDFIAMAFDSPILDLPHLGSYTVGQNIDDGRPLFATTEFSADYIQWVELSS